MTDRWQISHWAAESLSLMFIKQILQWEIILLVFLRRHINVNTDETDKI